MQLITEMAVVGLSHTLIGVMPHGKHCVDIQQNNRLNGGLSPHVISDPRCVVQTGIGTPLPMINFCYEKVYIMFNRIVENWY